MSYLEKLRQYTQRDSHDDAQPVTETPMRPSTPGRITIEATSPAARPIYWEGLDGEWHGFPIS